MYEDDNVDISRDILTIKIIIPHRTTEFDRDAVTYAKMIRKINKYNEIVICRFDEFNKYEKIMIQTLDDIHIYIGDIEKKWCKYTKNKYFVMDHELLKRRFVLNDFFEIDTILCRNKKSNELSKKLKDMYNFKYKIEYTKFGSFFPEKEIVKHWNVILHFAGEYHKKQTDVIIKTWQNNPDLPLIIIICSDHCFRNVEELLKNGGYPVNMHFHKKLLDPDELTIVKNKIGIHLCPSLIEGYGHSINEARKVKSFIITTNISPLNELVNESCAIMIDCDHCDIKKNGSELCVVTENQIYNSVMKAIKLSVEEKKQMTDIAYKLFLDDLYEFEKSVIKMLNNSKNI